MPTPRPTSRLPVRLFWSMNLLGALSLATLAAQQLDAPLVSDVARHLGDKDLTYVALFVACLSISANMMQVKMMFSRMDAWTKALSDLYTELRQRPCVRPGPPERA